MTREEIKAYLENYDENRMRASLRVMQGKEDDPFAMQFERLMLCIDCLPDYLNEVIKYKYIHKIPKRLYPWMAKGTLYKRINKALEYIEICMKDLEAIYDKND